MVWRRMIALNRTAIGLPASQAPGRPVVRVAGVTVHHSDGLTLDQQAGQDADGAIRWWRNIWSFHTGRPLPATGTHPAVTPWSGARGWADIGYHLGAHLPSRTLLAGRPYDRQGAHAPGANVTRLGLVVLGGNPAVDGDDVRWLAGVIDRMRTDVGYPQVWTIDGHRDHRNTGCPGSHLYAALPALHDPPPAGRPDDTHETERTVQRILARLDDIERTAVATLTAQIAWHRASVGLDPSPVDDARWARRINDDRATVGEALGRITQKANDRAAQ